MASPSQSLRSLTHLILEARSSQANILGTDHEPAHWTSYGRLIPNILRIAATLEDLPESLEHFDEQALGEASVVLINRLGIGFDEARSILETTLAMVQAIFEQAVEQAENIVAVVAEQMAAPAGEDAGEGGQDEAGEGADAAEGEDKDAAPEVPTPLDPSEPAANPVADPTEPPADPSNPAEADAVQPPEPAALEAGVTNAPDVGGEPVDQAPGASDSQPEGEGALASGDGQAPPADAPTLSEPTDSAGEAATSSEPDADGDKDIGKPLDLPIDDGSSKPADGSLPAEDAPAAPAEIEPAGDEEDKDKLPV